jgi:type II secretory ATPase GspE/PulE/Tfp pilus assembly ATPase PilB-like protein
MQINPRGGVTFPTALRAVLRSDPDIVMVGEIRDIETASISLEAALTGHFVLSTLHTNDAPGALTRLNDMGIEPFVTGSAITAVLAQRLVRKLCEHCKESYRPAAEQIEEWGFSPEEASTSDGLTLYRRRGCDQCSKGYLGRVGVFQLMVMSPPLQRLVVDHATREELEQCAFETGMKTLWADGLAKVAAGITTIEELERVAR